MFIWFLQKKGFVNNKDFDYLQTKLTESKQRGKDRYYSEFLTLLFFEGFAKKPIERSQRAKELLGKIKYLNGGLFVPHQIEEKYKTRIKIQDKAFEKTFNIFKRYDWCLEGKKGKSDKEISPDVLGYIFEKYINELQQKSLGAYYTKDEITSYLSRNTIQKCILEKVNKKGYNFQNVEELFHKLDTSLCKSLLTDEDSILNTLTVLDPAVGSGAFLVSAMKELINIYSPIIGKIKTMGDRDLTDWLKDFEEKNKSVPYGIKKNIILKNLYGVDIMKEGTEVCKLRLFLSLVSSALEIEELEPLPNIDFNIMCGNSLIGFLRESETAPTSHTAPYSLETCHSRESGNPLEKGTDTQIVWSEILGEDYSQIKDRYNQLVSRYKNQPLSFAKLKELKGKTNQFLEDYNQKLNLALAKKCSQADVKYPEVKDIQGKKNTKKRTVRPEDFNSTEGERNLNPFHWDFAFNAIMSKGGFDVIITNPPWEKIKNEDKEFFHKYDQSIDKKKTKCNVLKKKKRDLLKKSEIKKDYFKTEEFYQFQRDFFSNLYQYQSGKIINIDGATRKPSGDMNTYQLFTERCFDLLSKQGALGIVLPSGLCKDERAVGLRRELLFSSKTQISGLIDFQNQMEKGKGTIFEGVHPSFKFLLLNLQKTESNLEYEFPCYFHARDLKALEHFSNSKYIPDRSKNPTKEKDQTINKTSDNKRISTNIIPCGSEVVWQSIRDIKKLSPRDCSIIEFKNQKDKEILKKACQFPKVDEKIDHSWNPIFYTEFHETNDSHLFKDKKESEDDLPLYKGSAIYQYEFDYNLSYINRYIDKNSKKVRTGKGGCFKNKCYQNYRLVVRTIARNTDERSLISAVIPKDNFISNSLYGVHIESNKENFSTLSKKSSQFGSVLPVYKAENSRKATIKQDGEQQILKLNNRKSGTLEGYLSNKSKQPNVQNYKYILLLQSFLNSFVVDYFIRQKVSSNINKKYITPLHIPRLTEKDPYFKELVERSAKLTCIGKEFNELADEIGIPRGGVTDQQERWKIQGEIDAIVAYIYGLTLEEFTYILSTFTTGKNQERLNTLKNYALEAFKQNDFSKKAS